MLISRNMVELFSAKEIKLKFHHEHAVKNANENFHNKFSSRDDRERQLFMLKEPTPVSSIKM